MCVVRSCSNQTVVGHDKGIEYCLCALETKSVFILKFKFSCCEGNIKIKEDYLLRRILFECLFVCFFQANCFYLTGARLLGLAKSKLQIKVDRKH